MTDKAEELLAIARQAIDEASGNAAKAKLILSRKIRAKDLSGNYRIDF